MQSLNDNVSMMLTHQFRLHFFYPLDLSTMATLKKQQYMIYTKRFCSLGSFELIQICFSLHHFSHSMKFESFFRLIQKNRMQYKFWNYDQITKRYIKVVFYEFFAQWLIFGIHWTSSCTRQSKQILFKTHNEVSLFCIHVQIVCSSGTKLRKFDIL